MKRSITSTYRPLLCAVSAFLIAITALSAMPRNAQAQRYATQLVGFGPEGIASEYNSTSGTVINPNFVRRLSGSVELAIMGKTLFVSTFNDGTVGAYDATSGA